MGALLECLDESDAFVCITLNGWKPKQFSQMASLVTDNIGRELFLRQQLARISLKSGFDDHFLVL